MSLINRENLLSHYGDDLDIVEDLIEIFESTYPETVTSIEKALSENNFSDLELHAHTLKGMCANFFCDEVKNACFELEKMGKNGALDNEDKHIELIKKQLPEVVEELKNFQG